MEAGLTTSSTSSAASFLINKEPNRNTRLTFSWFSCRKTLNGGGQRSLIVARANKRKEKPDSHSFIPKPDEATGPFPEAVLLKKKVVKEDGRVVPEFADGEEEKLYDFLKLQLESDLKLERFRHYEVVYLIHEDHIEEVDNVVSKVQDFIREKKGRIWRLNNWGLRRLCYKIKKASKANFILMNFEMEAKWINGFKRMLDEDERIIRHLVMKRDEAITEDCPPPPEFHTIKAAQGIDIDYKEEDDDDDDDDQWLVDDELGVEDDDFEDVDDNDFGIDNEVNSTKKLKEKIQSIHRNLKGNHTRKLKRSRSSSKTSRESFDFETSLEGKAANGNDSVSKRRKVWQC